MSEPSQSPHVGAEAGDGQEPSPGQPRPSSAAERALAEAAARRAALDARSAALAREPERDGRGGLDPVRYADWEIGGRAVDF